MTRVLQIERGDLLEPARPVKCGSPLVGYRFVVGEAVVAGRADGLFIETLGIEFAALQACGLRADQRSVTCKVLWAVFSPHLELAVVAGQGLSVFGALGG